MKDKTPIFISYARSDGKSFADDLRRRLIDEYRFQVWQDVVELEGGKDWWLQIEAAIKSVEFLVMVMTPGALASQTTRKEWRLARQEGNLFLTGNLWSGVGMPDCIRHAEQTAGEIARRLSE